MEKARLGKVGALAEPIPVSVFRNEEFRAEIVWRNVIGIALMHIFTVASLFIVSDAKAHTIVWAVVFGYTSEMGITLGAHRLWTHRGYKARFMLRVFLMLLNTSAMQNSIYVWVRDHRVHHKYSDTNADPHNIGRGFFFAHVGWLMMKKHPEVISKGSKIDLSDLRNDPVVMFQYKYYYLLALIFGIIFPIWVPCYFWGEYVYVAGFANLLRYVIQLNCTWMVNSGAHSWGYKPYDKSIKPTDSLTVNLFAYGEGFHNYHHSFPFDYRCEEMRFSPINLSALWIDLLASLGLAYDLRIASKEMIKARMERTGDVNDSPDPKEVEHDY